MPLTLRALACLLAVTALVAQTPDELLVVDARIFTGSSAALILNTAAIRHDTRGRLNFSPADLRAFLTRALDAGEQPMFHAVGDAAIDVLLEALEATGGEKWRALRPRIEHGDLIEPSHGWTVP